MDNLSYKQKIENATKIAKANPTKIFKTKISNTYSNLIDNTKNRFEKLKKEIKNDSLQVDMKMLQSNLLSREESFKITKQISEENLKQIQQQMQHGEKSEADLDFEQRKIQILQKEFEDKQKRDQEEIKQKQKILEEQNSQKEQDRMKKKQE